MSVNINNMADFTRIADYFRSILYQLYKEKRGRLAALSTDTMRT